MVRPSEPALLLCDVAFIPDKIFSVWRVLDAAGHGIPVDRTQRGHGSLKINGWRMRSGNSVPQGLLYDEGRGGGLITNEEWRRGE